MNFLTNASSALVSITSNFSSGFGINRERVQITCCCSPHWKKKLVIENALVAISVKSMQKDQRGDLVGFQQRWNAQVLGCHLCLGNWRSRTCLEDETAFGSSDGFALRILQWKHAFIHAQTQACRCMCRLPEEEMKPKYCLFVAACVYLHILDDGSHHKDLLRKYWMEWWAGLRPKYGPICCKVTR